MRLAYFSPLRPQHSGVADYSEELLSLLAAKANITLFVDGFKPESPEISEQFEIVDYRAHPQQIDRLKDFDAIIYHMGNDHRYHTGMLAVMLSYPGIVVLHDFALQDFYLGLARDASQFDYYLDEIEYSHGQERRKEAETTLLSGGVPSIVSRPLEFPLNRRIINSAEGVIVHSRWARNRIISEVPGMPVVQIPHLLKFHADQPPSTSTTAEVRIANFGLITPAKGIESALSALSKLRATHRFRYTLVGEPNAFYDIRNLIQKYGMDDLVEITGHVSLDDFNHRITHTDIALNMRDRTVGETSGSLVRLLAAGVCSIVSDVGWYAEIPDDCVVKVPLNQHTHDVLLAYLDRLITDAQLRQRIGGNAQRYARVEHAPARCADAYLEFVDHVIARRIQRELIANVSSELNQLGIKATDDSMLESVAVEVSGLAIHNSKSFAATREINSPPQASPNGHNSVTKQWSNPTARTPKVAGIDYKQAAREYLAKLSDERQHHLRTKPFYNLANKPAKYRNDGMEEDMHRHFCDFANMAVKLALPAGSRILDVGCGSGWLSEYFGRLGYVVKGIDISPDLIAMSSDRVARVPYGVDPETPLRCTFAVHDIELSPLSEKFDAIICYDSLHHFADEAAVMQNLGKMLSVGGVLFILEGERPLPGSTGEAELRAVMDEFQTLESPFDNTYLRSLLNDNGFAIVGDYISVNGLFDRELIEDKFLPLRNIATGYHYLHCKKLVADGAASTVPDSRNPGQLRAQMRILNHCLSENYQAGELIEFELEIINTGDTLWLAAAEPRFGIVMPALKILNEQGVLLSESHGEPALPRPIAPGEVVKLRLAPVAPEFAGDYVLKVDLVVEHVCWFEERGSEPLLVAFKVT